MIAACVLIGVALVLAVAVWEQRELRRERDTIIRRSIEHERWLIERAREIDAERRGGE